MGTTDIYNYLKVDENTITGGQPDEAQLRAAAAEGFEVVINLATLNPETAIKNEADLVQSLGMVYFHLPVVWDSPTKADFAAFEQVMLTLASRKLLLHCAANFRATAFYSLYARKHLGWSPTQAETFRAQIWQGSDYPVWQAFIQQMEAK